MNTRIPFVRRILAVLAVFLTFATLPALAQFNASLSGTVVDSTGAVIPGATVTLTDPQTGQVRTLKTDGSGVYTFSSLAPASYKIEATASNFSKATPSSTTRALF